MKLSLVILALFGCAVHGLFFGCDMQAAPGVAAGGYGQVACFSAADNSGAVTMACTWKYANLTSNPTLAHFHVGTSIAAAGPVVIKFNGAGWTTKDAGTAFQRYTAADLGTNWVQQGTTTFPDQVTACATGGCYFNLHTSNYGSGELTCQLNALGTTYNYQQVALGPATGAVNTTGLVFGIPTTSQGLANLVMGPVGSSHVWGYEVNFLTFSPISAAHIHQATSVGGNGGVKVGFDLGNQVGATLGRFVGIAMEGITAGQQSSYWPVYAADFDTALASHFCYLNVHTDANAGGEIRANLAPNSATQATLAVFAIVAMIASFLSL